MTLFLSVILLRLVLEDDYLLALAIFYYCSCYSSSYVRSTYFNILTFAENEYLVKSYNVTNRSIQLFDCDDVTFLYSLLLTACFNYCVHLMNSSSIQSRHCGWHSVLIALQNPVCAAQLSYHTIETAESQVLSAIFFDLSIFFYSDSVAARC